MLEKNHTAESAVGGMSLCRGVCLTNVKHFQALGGAVLVAFALMIEGPTASDPTPPLKRPFLQIPGTCVFVVCLLVKRRRGVGAQSFGSGS